MLERIGRLSELTANLLFYINNPLVMKAILFCDEPYFRYIHEVGEETSAVGPKTIFPWLTNDGPGRHSSFHMMENKR